jgi:hypothetical protein
VQSESIPRLMLRGNGRRTGISLLWLRCERKNYTHHLEQGRRVSQTMWLHFRQRDWEISHPDFVPDPKM